MNPTKLQQKSIDAVSSAFASNDPKQQAAVRAVREAFGGAEPKTAPLPPTPTTTPPTDTTRYSRLTPVEQQAQNTLASPMQNQESLQQIQARKAQAAQAEIDALNRVYQDKLASQRTVNQGQERQTSSVSTLTGLAGSTEANVASTQTEALGNKQLDAIRNEQATAIQSILSDVRNSANEEARLQTQDARQSAKDILNLRVAKQAENVQRLSFMGANAGASLEGIKAELGNEAYDSFINSVGGESAAKGILFDSRGKNVVASSRIGDYWAQTTTLPDGTQTQEYIPLPQEVLDSEKAGAKLETTKTDNGTFYSLDGGVTWKKITGSAKPSETVADTSTVSDLTEGILANIASLKDLTPSGREEVIAEIYRSGRGGELSNKMDQYAVQKADSVLPAIDLALNQLDESEVGFLGPASAKIPGTNTFRLQSTLDTIFANIAFGELTAMRAASPTGGALGQVSERELALLGAVQASLKLGIGETLMKKNLKKVKKVFEDIKKRAGENEATTEQILRSPDGTGEVNIADLTPAQIQEAKTAGWI